MNCRFVQFIPFDISPTFESFVVSVCVNGSSVPCPPPFPPAHMHNTFDGKPNVD